MEKQQISLNFAVAKVVAILVVVTAHFFSPSPLWILATVALFIFGFSSAYFTQSKYQAALDVRAFWSAKFIRLGWPLLVMNCFLWAVFAYQAKSPLWDWQTPFHWLGLSGWFNWLGLVWPSLSNHSPWGAGLWFFTLLLLFYALYPGLRWCCRSIVGADLTLVLASIVLAWAHHWLPVGHMLWLTALSFVLGLWWARRKIQAQWLASLLCLLAGLVLFGLFKWLGVSADCSFYWIFLVSVGAVGLLMSLPLPAILAKLRHFDDAVIQIYFIHMALFVSVSAYASVNYVLSLSVILLSAQVLAWLTQRLAR